MIDQNNFRVVTLEVVTSIDLADNLRDDLLIFAAENEYSTFILATETRELGDGEWDEVQSEISPELLNQNNDYGDD